MTIFETGTVQQKTFYKNYSIKSTD
ncbi:hypothetical protein CY0110_18957 [Crocosphaera chwakensis CCY0110]|uniref:Uncharacterized protein n=1 Tax=Crocosphaera chwakensis CCY0110 TaxID=391612 RepID=A3IJC3_9CHRO|nr:hypothetical protein CY0110_18957 [Crocosphaera chwakensis CCY0110]